MDKPALRRTYSEIRMAITPVDAAKASALIAHQIQDMLSWGHITRVHAYRSLLELREVDTAWLADFIAGYPHIRLTYGDPLPTAPIPKGEYDVIIVPLLAFDSSGARLGYGGGWYDRFLSRQVAATKIGLAFETQRSPTPLPVESHDMELDYVVTESDIVGL